MKVNIVAKMTVVKEEYTTETEMKEVELKENEKEKAGD
jgi:hypothetical protein